MQIRTLWYLMLPLLVACAISEIPGPGAGTYFFNVGSDRKQFEAAVSRGLAFIVVGACDPQSEIRGIDFESGPEEVVALFGERLAGMYAVDPRLFRLRSALSMNGSGLVSFSRDLTLEPETVNYIGGIVEAVGEHGKVEFALVDCPELLESLPALFPYQIARLPFRVVRPGR